MRKAQKYKIGVLSLMISLGLFSCGGGSDVDLRNAALQEVDSANAGKKVEIDMDEVSKTIASIPSPIEIAFLIKDKGGEYNNTFLNSTENKSKYGTAYEKAINLGVYGADLAYVNLYEKASDGVSYLSTVAGLADELEIGQFFDIETLKELTRNSENMDSLLNITMDNFDKINNYFQQQNRSQLSILLLVGGWVEGSNLLNRVHVVNPTSELRERIGEQKIVLEQILRLLRYFEHDPNIKEILDSFTPLMDVYKGIKIEQVEGEPKMEFKDGFMQVTSGTVTLVKITDDQAKEIFKLTEQIRNKLIKE